MSSTSKSAVTERLEQLLAEIRAINDWDLDCLSRKANDSVDRAAWTARRIRLREIRQQSEILQICLHTPIKPARN